MSFSSPQVVNRLLAALPDAEYQRLVPHLERVSLPLKQVLHKVGEPIEYVRTYALTKSRARVGTEEAKMMRSPIGSAYELKSNSSRLSGCFWQGVLA